MTNTSSFAPDDEKDPRDLGKLHALVSAGLPDFWNRDNLLDVRKLADEIDVSFQAIYSWFERESISAKRVDQVIYLSQKTSRANRPKAPWKPLCRDDFWEFLGR